MQNTSVASAGAGKSEVECWTCGEKGHLKFNCPKCKGKKKKGGKAKDDSAATAITQTQDDYGFAASPEVAIISRDPFANISTSTEGYDMGASQHMSPDRQKFTNFMEIEPKPVKAADKAIFMATGIGSLIISIPNGSTSTNLTLKDVLYCLDLAFTLVSLNRCDVARYTVQLKDRACVINDKAGRTIGRIPLTNGLYRVDREAVPATAVYSSIKIFSLDDVHCKMGHISHKAVKRLIEEKIILGIDLDKE